MATLINNVIRVAAAPLGAGALLAATAGMASAWPIPITPEQQRYINQARGAGFPSTNTVGLIGQSSCRATDFGNTPQPCVHYAEDCS